MLRATALISFRLMLLIALGLAGCRDWQQTAPTGKTLLKPIDAAEASMRLEIISIRCPLGDEALNKTIWSEIDEQQLPAAVREQLAEEGFRVGVISGQIPAALAERIAATEQQPVKAIEAAARLQEAPAVSRRQLQLFAGWRGEIVASNVYPSLPLLTHDGRGIAGKTYPQAQGILTAKTQALGGRLIKLQLTPELQYGEPRQQWVSDDGILRPQSGKPKRTFERLAFDTSLSPGQMLLLTCQTERRGTLGHYFFTEPVAGSGDEQQLQQKLLVIRMADCRYDDLFEAPTIADVSAPTPISSKR
jgi:hypothetical protein